MAKDAALQVFVVDGCVTIQIGIDTLVNAFNRAEFNNPYNDEAVDYIQKWKVDNPVKFAAGVIDEIEREGEDGSTPLTRFLDSMFEAALDQGCDGIEDEDA